MKIFFFSKLFSTPHPTGAAQSTVGTDKTKNLHVSSVSLTGGSDSQLEAIYLVSRRTCVGYPKPKVDSFVTLGDDPI